MVVEVNYQTKKNAADPHSHFKHVECFEADTMPDVAAIAKKLSAMKKDFAEGSISITEREGDEADIMRRKGFRVIKFKHQLTERWVGRSYVHSAAGFVPKRWLSSLRASFSPPKTSL
jgi:hypothetical protein